MNPYLVDIVNCNLMDAFVLKNNDNGIEFWKASLEHLKFNIEKIVKLYSCYPHRYKSIDSCKSVPRYFGHDSMALAMMIENLLRV